MPPLGEVISPLRIQTGARAAFEYGSWPCDVPFAIKRFPGRAIRFDPFAVSVAN
jgi:hypothetical protein